jgi:leucyl-tRNA synthetase
MSFSIFQHTAIFPEEKRQQGTLNLGMLILEGKKMSSSKGNVILINDICEKIGADNVRLFLMNSVEPWEEMNWQQKEVEKGINTMNSFLKAFYIEAMKSAKAKKLDEKKLKGINAWLYNKFNEHLNNYIDFMESFELRKAIQEITFKFFNDLKWYEHRIKQEEKPVELINYVISNWTKCIAPFMPHIAEEFWRSALLNKESIFLAGLPEKKKLNKTIEAEENIVRNTLNDAIEVIKLSKIEKPKKIILIVAAEWKKKAIELLAKKLNKIDLKEAMSILMTLKEAKENPKITERIAREFTQRFSELKELKTINEMKALNEAKSFFEKELNTAIEIIEEEKSTQIKAKNALPFKPAIVVE